MKILESGSVSQHRIEETDIVNAFNTVLNIIAFLKENKLIKKDPQFRLGSTKLAYRIFQKKLNKLVDDIDNEDYNQAELNRLKDGFGDLDIDLVLSDGVSLDDVEAKILEKFGDSIWKTAPKGERAPGQLHFGFKIGNKVHQVDFVEISGKTDQDVEDAYKVRDYFSGSSATDEAAGIKGLFNKEMHYALSRLVDPNEIIKTFAKKEGKTFEDKSKEYDAVEKREIDIFKQELKDEKISKGYIVDVEGKKYPVLGATKGKLKLGSEITDMDNINITPSMEVDAIKASFVLYTKRRVSLIESKLQEKYGITYRLFLYRQKFKESEGKIIKSLESTPKKVILDYIPITQQDEVIQTLLGDKATTKELFSAIETAKYIGKHFPDDKKIEFWDIFVEQALEKRNKIRMDRKTGQPAIDPDTGKPEVTGQVSEEKYDASMKQLGKLIGIDKLLGADFYVHPKGDDEKAALTEQRKDLIFYEAESIRTGIGRFEGTGKVSGDDFLNALKALYPHVKEDGILHPNTASNVDVVEKIDSSFCHFGINKEGKFFLASSNSGEVTEDNFEHKFRNNPDFLESFRFLKDHKLLHVVLKNISKELGKPVKFEAEILPSITYQPDEAGNITFVGTRYAKEKLGDKGTFVVFKAQVYDGDEWSKVSSATQRKMISDVMDADSQDWKILSNDVHMKVNQDINFGVDFKQLDNYLGTDEGFKKLQALMDSKITPEKRRVKEVLADIRIKMQTALDGISNSLTSVLGNDFIEGVVLRIKDDNGSVQEIKGTSEKFSKNKETLWKHRDQLEELYDTFRNAIKTNVLHLKLSTDRAINQKFLDTVQEFKATENDKDAAVNEFLIQVINQLIDKEADFSDVKGVAKKLVAEYKSTIHQLKADYRANMGAFDVNSARKTKEAFDIYDEKFGNLFNILIGETADDLQYVLGCFKAIYDGKAKNLLTSIEPSTEVKTKKCVLWVGRAQPWHKGHDEMVRIGLQKAEAVYIIIVKGEKSGEDESKNPLSAETQKDLIRSIYGDSQVIVSDSHPSKVSLPFIMMDLYSKGLEAIGWLVGEDRKEAYKGEIVRFNFGQWMQGHKYAPVSPSVEFILTPRLVSGTEARDATRTMDFAEWVKQFAPSNISSSAKSAYKKAYAEIRGPENLSKKLTEMFTDPKQATIDFDKQTTPEDQISTPDETPPEKKDDDKPSDAIKDLKKKLDDKESDEQSSSSKKEFLNKDFKNLFKNEFFIPGSFKNLIPEDALNIIENKIKSNTNLLSKELTEALLSIINTVRGGDTSDKEFKLEKFEEDFIEIYFSELMAPITIAIEGKTGKQNAVTNLKENIKLKEFSLADVKFINFPSSSSNKLFDSTLVDSAGLSFQISSKAKKGANAAITSLTESYNNAKNTDALKELSTTLVESDNGINLSFCELFELLTKVKTSLKEDISGYDFNTEVNSILGPIVLSIVSIPKFSKDFGVSLYKLLLTTKIPKATSPAVFISSFVKLINSKLENLELKKELINTLTANIDWSLTRRKIIQTLAYKSTKNFNSNKHNSDNFSKLLKTVIENSDIIQVNASYDKKLNTLSYKIIYPMKLTKSIKIDATKNYSVLEKTKGGLSFEIPKD